MIALAFDEDRKDRPFCEDAILPVERTICSTYQHIRACRSGSLCVPLIPSSPSGPGLSGLPHPSSSSHNSLASRIQEFNRHTRVIGPPSFYLLLYYFYFSVHASLRFFTSSSAHSFPFLLFMSSSVPSPVRMIKSLTHSLTPSSVRRRLSPFLPPGPPLSIVESTLRRAKHCTLWPLCDGDYSSSGMCVGSFPFDV